MTSASFCSGICAPEVAWRDLSIEPVFFSEIDPFASAVEAHHFPGVPNLGDMEAITREQLERYRPDVVVAGTPCQSFSVAGLRGGMADPRGNLALVFLRLVDWLRSAWVVWENVPGILSSDGGRDFGSFLGGLGQLGYGWAYRVLDAQHFGVPQRRRRVFVVGHLGDWRRAVAVLFERHCLSGYPAPSREAGERTADRVAGCLNSGGGNGGFRTEPGEHLITATLTGNGDAHSGFRDERGLVAHSLRADGFDASEDGTGRGTPLVPIAFYSNESHSSGANIDISPTIRVGTGLGIPSAPAIAFAQNQRDELRTMDVAGAIAAEPGMKQQTYVFAERGRQGERQIEWMQDVAYSQQARTGGGATDRFNVAHRMAVRRLTPRECERLQGFPDDYTLIQYRGKPAADGPRYRALGNSMAVPVLRWIGRRILEAASLPSPSARPSEEVARG